MTLEEKGFDDQVKDMPKNLKKTSNFRFTTLDNRQLSYNHIFNKYEHTSVSVAQTATEMAVGVMIVALGKNDERDSNLYRKKHLTAHPLPHKFS